MSAFVYLWINKNTKQWYVGSRTAKKCHVNDGYVCSSKYVRHLIKTSRGEWGREVNATSNAEDMIKLETMILTAIDAINDTSSLNKHNGDGKFTVSGKKVGPMSEEISKSCGANSTAKLRREI